MKKILLFLVVASLFWGCQPAGPKVKIVAVLAGHCELCALQKPALEAIERDYAKKIAVERYDIDVYGQYQESAKFNAKTTPTLIFFNRKGEEVFRKETPMSAPEIREVLNKYGVR